jgi:hypothetical protein
MEKRCKAVLYLLIYFINFLIKIPWNIFLVQGGCIVAIPSRFILYIA